MLKTIKRILINLLIVAVPFTIGILAYNKLGNWGFGEYGALVYLIPLLVITVLVLRYKSK